MKMVCMLLFPLLLTSCIDFDRQTLSYHYDEELYTLRIFQNYEGLFGSEKGEGITSEEKQQLASLYENGRTFFFGNWIWEYNETSTRAFANEPFSKENEDVDGPPTPQEREAHQALLAVARLLLAHVHIDNGAFYRNAQGELCAYQRVTIHQVSQIIDAANIAIAKHILEIDGPGNLREYQQLRPAAVANHAYIRREGNQFSYHWPLPHSEFKRVKNQWSQALKAAIQSELPAEKNSALISARNLMEQEIWLSYLDDILVVTAGYPTNTLTRVQLDGDKDPIDNLGDYIGRTYGVDNQLDVKKIEQDFLLGK